MTTLGLWAEAHLGTDRVEIDVGHAGDQCRLVQERHRFVPPLPEGVFRGLCENAVYPHFSADPIATYGPLDASARWPAGQRS